MLQGKSVDLIEAAQEARVVINTMRAEKGGPSVWKEVHERGKHIAAEFDIEPSMPRTTGRQEHRVNVHRKSDSDTVTPKKCKFLQLCEHQLSVKVTPTWCTFTPQ